MRRRRPSLFVGPLMGYPDAILHTPVIHCAIIQTLNRTQRPTSDLVVLRRTSIRTRIVDVQAAPRILTIVIYVI